MSAHGTLLVLAPSHGFGGGIERVASAVERAWPHRCVRVDLYRRERVEHASASPSSKARFAARVVTIARRERPAMILCLHVGLLPVAVSAAPLAGGRVALMAIGHEVWGAPSRPARILLTRCSHLVAISVFTAQTLARRFAVDVGRITVVPLPVDEALLSAAREVPSGVVRAPELLTVSRVVAAHRYKGHFAIAEAMPQVLASCPGARWTVVGDGDDIPALQARCVQLGIAERVRFAGRVSDEALAEMYTNASALVLPSVADPDGDPPTGEGFGLVYGEAGAFGTPSIASTASGGAAELVTAGETGLLVAPGDCDALATAILSLLEDRALADRLGRAMRARVFARHTDAHFGQALLAALR